MEQGRTVLSYLPWLEFLTIAAVLLIIAGAFRSLVAPLLALAVSGIAVLLTLHLGGALADRLEIPVPQETQPLLVALLLGVVTDYVVFYLSAMRRHLASGIGRLAAAERATAGFTAIIATAGATAAAGTGALIVAQSPAFRTFGPGMALAVGVGMVVSVTLVPALLAILGPAALWSPRRRSAAEPTEPTEPPDPTESTDPIEPTAEPRSESSGRRWAWLVTRPAFSVVVLLVCGGGLIAAALPLRHLSLGVSFVDSPPCSDRAMTPSRRRSVSSARRTGPPPATCSCRRTAAPARR